MTGYGELRQPVVTLDLAAGTGWGDALAALHRWNGMGEQAARVHLARLALDPHRASGTDRGTYQVAGVRVTVVGRPA